VSPASIRPHPSTLVFGTDYELRGYQVTRNTVTMTQSDIKYQTQRYTFRVVTLSMLVRSREDQYRWIVRQSSFIKPDPPAWVFDTVYELRGYQVTRNAVTMAPLDNTYQTHRYTSRVITLSMLVRSRYDQYRWIVRESSFHKASPFDIGFRY
jgi:hypothetical protein